MSTNRFVLAFATLVAALVVLAPAAAAHASANTEDGKYRITWGLLEEPGFTHEKNRLDVIIRELVDPATNQTGDGVGGIAAEDLTLTLLKGDERLELGGIAANRGVKGASVGPGNYTSAEPFFLTSPGIYRLLVQGEIDGTPVDMEIQATHAYESIGDIAFPDPYEPGAADTGALEAQIAALTARVAALEADAQTQSTTPATVTPQTTGSDVPLSAMLVALGIVAAALILRRSRP